MAEISNVTLAVLVFAALVVVIAGTALNFMSTGNGLTGFAVAGTGNVTLTIATTLAIQVNQTFNTINFGACGTRSTPYWCATNDSLICNGVNDNNCTGDTGALQFIQIENVGNVNASITITANSCDAATLIGGTSPAFDVIAGNCTIGPLATWTAVTTTPSLRLCDTLVPTTGPTQIGRMAVFANITIPSNARQTCAQNYTQMTFTGALA